MVPVSRIIPQVLQWLMISKQISCQAVFSSTEEMGKLLKLEKQLVEEMKRHSEDLETALTSIEEYVSQVAEVTIPVSMPVYRLSAGVQLLLSRGGVHGGDDNRTHHWQPNL